jgi:hypothetical protein
MPPRARFKPDVAVLALILFWGMLVCGLTATASKGQTGPSEDQIMGAYLLNFAQLVTWPPETYGSPDDPTVIGVPAGDSLLSVLDDALDRRHPNGRPIKLLAIKSLDQIKQCRILFIREAGKLNLSDVLTVAGDIPLLTVSDIKSATSEGITIWLFEENGRIGFDINRRGERRSGFRIDSRLLRLARNVLE